MTLEPCRELRELELEAGYFLHRKAVACISTITSTDIEKIIIKCGSCKEGNDFWKSLDQILTELVGREERKIRLVVRFRENVLQESREICLRELIEKGGVTVSEKGYYHG